MRKIKRLIAGFLSCFMMLSSTQVSASPEPTDAEAIGTSLYSVSTALTAYANRVVGSNTNDKHADHTLSEMKGKSAGVAGAYVGYGDEKKGFYPYISSSNSKAATTSSYDAWLNVGDGGSTYSYLRYGRLLNDLGLDETRLEGDNGTMRNVLGTVMSGVNMVASFVPTIFDGCLKVLRTLNPFNFFIDTNVGEIIQGYEDSAHASGMISGDKGFLESVDGALKPVKDFLSGLYNWFQNFGLFTILPLLLGFLFWTLLMTKQHGKGRKVIVFVQRLFFIIIGVPLLGVMYSAVLNMVSTNVQDAPPAAQMVSSSFVDFQGWVDHGRLAPPTGISLVSAGVDTDDNKSNSVAGVADQNTIRNLRYNVFEINKAIGHTDGKNPIGVPKNDGNIDVSGGIWNEDDLNYNVFYGSDEQKRSASQKASNLLDQYRAGTRYPAAAWDTAVNSILSTPKSKGGHKEDLGHTSATGNASSNDGKIYGMFASTDDVSDWMDREIDDNEKIFSGRSYPNGGEWSGQVWNIFDNGVLNNGHGDNQVDEKSTLTFTGVGWDKNTDGRDPDTAGGLSTVAMYNYLSSDFTNSSVSTYSANNSSSTYVKPTHFSVNLIGSGVVQWAYGLNCIAILCVVTVIGLLYGIGMVISNIKRTFSLFMQLPGAMIGVLHMIVQSIVYVVMMVLEILATVVFYTIINQLLIVVATIIETPINNLISGHTSSSLIGGVLASVGISVPTEVLYGLNWLFPIALMIVTVVLSALGVGFVKSNKSLMMVYEYVWCKLFRAVTFKEFRPAFDEWFATRRSLYVWDFNTKIFSKVWECQDDISKSFVKGAVC